MIDSDGNPPLRKGRNNQMNYNTIIVRGLAQLGLLTLTYATLGFGQTPTPVVVKNGVRESVPIRDLSGQTAVAFQFQFHFSTSPIVAAQQSYHVPPFKRLVIEHITFGARVYGGQSIRALFTTRLDQVDYVSIYGHSHRLADEHTDLLSGDKLVKLYADGGTQVTAQLQASGLNNGKPGSLTIYGYLVDMPLLLQVAQ
jgi:hypothetical protein